MKCCVGIDLGSTTTKAVVLGAWTQGWFIIRQHPSEPMMRWLEDASLTGRQVAVFATYKLDVVAIPTNEPVRRVDYPDVIYKTRREKFEAALDEIESARDDAK